MDKLDLLQATATDLQKCLTEGTLTSVDLVKVYLKQINTFNDYLRAVIQTAPVNKLVERAEYLDKQRSGGFTCGPLHGIPILIKDNIDTHPALGLGTTCGSFALMHAKPKANAALVDGLINAGAIILGKANLSEFAWFLGDCAPCGWSAVGGQTESAYIKGKWDVREPFGGHGNTGGSSSGSAVAVSAGFAPISIGTETCGSLIMPANRAALYTMKPSIGLVSQAGIVPASDVCDAAGPMTKNVLDLANTLQVMVQPTAARYIPHGGYATALTKSWEGIKVGCLDPTEWVLDEAVAGRHEDFDNQQRREILEAYETIKKQGAQTKYPVKLVSPKKFEVDGGNALYDLWRGNLKRLLNGYLESLDESHVRSMDDIIAFNEKYKYLELPPGINQNYFSSCASTDWSAEQSEKAIAHFSKVGLDEGVNFTLNSHDVDVIIGPADCNLYEIVSASGCPAATLPLSTYNGNGRPFGLVAIAGRFQEALLLKVMSAWEATFPDRAVPSLEGKAQADINYNKLW